MKKLFYNGKIFTCDDDRPSADAMLITDGVIRAVGTISEIQNIPEKPAPGAPVPCEAVDLRGRTVIPAFTDCHMHPVTLAEYAGEIACLPPEVSSIEELKGRISEVRREKLSGRNFPSSSDGPGAEIDKRSEPSSEDPAYDWILGWGYDEGKFSEKRSPNRYDLDEASSDLPVALTRSCCHIKCVNSKALALAGIDRNTPDPEGGSIDRDADGEPTGILRETARYLIDPWLPKKTDEIAADQLVSLGEILLSQGITAICEMGTFSADDAYAIYTRAAEKGFRQEVGIYYMWDYFREIEAPDFSPEKTCRDQQIRNAGIKIIGDGSISGHTACCTVPYLGTEDCGIMTFTDEHLDTAIECCKKNHVQLSCHAMGGRTIDRILERVSREKPWMKEKDSDVPYLRMEHITEPSEKALRLARKNSVFWCTQPIFPYCEIESYTANLAPERIAHIYPIRSELRSGVRVALSTDAPATSWAHPSDPFPSLKSAVTRLAWDGTDTGSEEAIDIETAVKLYTRESAIAGGFRNLGVLKEGYKGNFVILSEDIFSAESEAIDQIRVEETYIRGERVFLREP